MCGRSPPISSRSGPDRAGAALVPHRARRRAPRRRRPGAQAWILEHGDDAANRDAMKACHMAPVPKPGEGGECGEKGAIRLTVPADRAKKDAAIEEFDPAAAAGRRRRLNADELRARRAAQPPGRSSPTSGDVRFERRIYCRDPCRRVYQQARSPKRSPSTRSTPPGITKTAITISGCRSSKRCCCRSWPSSLRTRLRGGEVEHGVFGDAGQGVR